MFRMLAFTLFFAATTGSVRGQPLPVVAAKMEAKTVTLDKAGTLAEITAELTKQTGLVFDLSGVDDKASVKAAFKAAPFWVAVEAVAEQAKCFVSVQGGKVKFTKRADGVSAVPSSIDEPFRVVLKKVIAKRDLEAAGTDYEFHLEVQWEARFPVYLIDTEPKASATVGKATIAANAASVRTLPSGSSHPAVVKLKNVPREAKVIDELAGTFRLIAAEKMLAIEFKDLTGAKPQTETVDGVSVTLHPMTAFPKRVQFTVGLEYPDGHPTFESFQSWTGANVLRLFAPTTPAGMTTDKYSIDADNGRKQTLSYNFEGPNGAAFTIPSLKGWRVVYETPGPLSEQTFAFKLKGIELP